MSSNEHSSVKQPSRLSSVTHSACAVNTLDGHEGHTGLVCRLRVGITAAQTPPGEMDHTTGRLGLGGVGGADREVGFRVGVGVDIHTGFDLRLYHSHRFPNQRSTAGAPQRDSRHTNPKQLVSRPESSPPTEDPGGVLESAGPETPDPHYHKALAGNEGLTLLRHSWSLEGGEDTMMLWMGRLLQHQGTGGNTPGTDPRWSRNAPSG